MTLIACLHPHQCRTLIADCLISAPSAPEKDLVLPMRTYLPPASNGGIHLQPHSLRRKVIEINSNVVALWAGNYQQARILATRVFASFRDKAITNSDMKSFLDAYYQKPVPNFLRNHSFR